MINNFKLNNVKSERHIDTNGYLFVEKSPILKSGVLEYYGSEFEKSNVDGVAIDPDRIYKVFLSEEEIEKAKETFKLLPLVNDHQWLGKEGESSKNYQEGTTGDALFVKDGKLYANLKFTDIDTIEEIENDEKVELSASYENKLARSSDPAYDFVAVNLKGNHVALVEKGRCGSDVRVLNNKKINNNKNDTMKKENDVKTKNDAKLILDGKEIDLNRFFEEEDKEGEHEDSTVSQENESSMEEVVKMLEGVLAKLKGSKTESENEEKDEEKKDEEKTENEEKEKDEEEVKSQNFDAVYSKVYNSVVEKLHKDNESKIKAYNHVKEATGDFDFSGLTEKDIYVKACNSLGLQVENEGVEELRAMVKAYNNLIKVDNSFNYGIETSKEALEIEFK